MSERDIAEARRLLSLLACAEPGAGAGPEPPADEAAPGELLERGRAILAARRRREELFGKSIFGEPAWDMLLLLYVGSSEARRTIGTLGELANIPKSTAIRWIDHLDKEGLVRREPHPTDRRSVFVELTPKGRRAIDQYLSAAFR